MTREEFAEDFQIGELVRLRLRNGECVSGSLCSIGATRISIIKPDGLRRGISCEIILDCEQMDGESAPVHDVPHAEQTAGASAEFPSAAAQGHDDTAEISRPNDAPIDEQDAALSAYGESVETPDVSEPGSSMGTMGTAPTSNEERRNSFSSPDVPVSDDIINARLKHANDEKQAEYLQAVRPVREEVLKDTDNPFQDYAADISVGVNYRKNARTYTSKAWSDSVERSDLLEKAESCYLKDIFLCSSEPEPSVKELLQMYGKSDTREAAVKGLWLLEMFDGRVTYTKTLVKREYSLFVKIGDADAVCSVLEAAVRFGAGTPSLFGPLYAHCMALHREGNWEAAEKFCSRYLELLQMVDSIRKPSRQWTRDVSQWLSEASSKTVLITKESSGDDRTDSVTDTALGSGPEPDAASEPAALKDTDESAYQSITSRTSLHEKALSGMMGRCFEYDSSILPSRYLYDRMTGISLSSLFSGQKDIYEKIQQDGAYVASTDECISSVEKLLSRPRSNTMSLDASAEMYAGLCRMLYDTRCRENTNRPDRLIPENASRFFTVSGHYLADASGDVDTLRFFYINALKNAGSNTSSPLFYEPANALMQTFFIEESLLRGAIHEFVTGKTRRRSLINFWKGNVCLFPNDFLIASFMLSETSDCGRQLIKMIKPGSVSYSLIMEKLKEIWGVSAEPGRLDSAWAAAYEVYLKKLAEVKDCITGSADNILKTEFANAQALELEKIDTANIFMKRDSILLKQYVSILFDICEIMLRYTSREQISGFNSMLNKSGAFLADIRSSPTEFGYEFLIPVIIKIQETINKKLDSLYKNSVPQISVKQADKPVFVKNKQVLVSVFISNAAECQDVYSFSAEFESSDGTKITAADREFSSIRSGDTQECIITLRVEKSVLAVRQFQIKYRVSYLYHSDTLKYDSGESSGELLVRVSDREFIPFENPYSKITDGASVPSKELFKGRDRLIRSIADSLITNEGRPCTNRGFILWGQRRVGKNSVKDFLKMEIENRFDSQFLIIDAGSTGDSYDLNGFFSELVSSCEDALSDCPDLESKFNLSGFSFNDSAVYNAAHPEFEFRKFLKRFSSALKRFGDGRVPLFFVDEFTYLYGWIEEGRINGTDFMRFWKALIQDCNSCFVMIGQDNVPAWESKYPNEFACMKKIPVSYLDRDGTKSLVTEPCMRNGVSAFDEGAVDLIYKWTRGSAYLIDILCEALVNYMNENAREFVTRVDVEIAFRRHYVDEVSEDERIPFDARKFQPQIHDASLVGDEGKQDDEKNLAILTEIAKKTAEAPWVPIKDLECIKKYGDEGLLRLKDRRIIDIEGPDCRIFMPLLKFYLLKKEGSLSEYYDSIIREA